MAITVSEVIEAAGLRYEPYPGWPFGGVFLTEGHQLIGSFSDLKRFQASDPRYFGWHAHHIVECHELSRLGVTTSVPSRHDQICVLLPAPAHLNRVTSHLRAANPLDVQASISELRNAYRDAYRLMGDYCGGGPFRVAQELMAIVDATFRRVADSQKAVNGGGKPGRA